MVMPAAWRRIYDGLADRASLPEAWQGVTESWTVSLSRLRSEQRAYLEIHNTYSSVQEDPSAAAMPADAARVDGTRTTWACLRWTRAQAGRDAWIVGF